jgi:hypothetical protein
VKAKIYAPTDRVLLSMNEPTKKSGLITSSSDDKTLRQGTIVSERDDDLSGMIAWVRPSDVGTLWDVPGFGLLAQVEISKIFALTRASECKPSS